ncbi:hypothetical protein N0V90_000568 [Kalmusia sp. IMI 367209]|nr:hypothetical protein N0V90_000568 [Kalmusia sp. IMI 367209]
MAQPPPAVPVSARVRKGFLALAANQEKMEAIRHNALISKFFDGSAPSTRNKREQARAQFECFVECSYGLTDLDQVWSNDTFISRTKQFFEGFINMSKGKFEAKIKASTLWSYKHALYWWSSVLVNDFNLLWQKWHEECAVREKNNLSDGELVLIFRYIMEQRYGIANLKQHWAAMLLVWLTAARPGSITVAAGYQKGASLDVPDKVRAVNETLRWSDVEFLHMKGGIAVRVTFRYHKGYRDPNKEKATADAWRTFLFLPSQGERLEFDLPIVLFGIAYKRGLFTQSLKTILDQKPSEAFLRKNPDVDHQAVFVAANQAGFLDPTEPMRINALNPKLQQLCAAVGLLERNTYYSICRTAIIKVRREHGTEAAKDIAFHKPSANSLFFYDNVGFGDIDMQQFRLGGPEGLTREEVRHYFSQANLARWDPTQEDEELSFKQLLDQQVKELLPKQEEFISNELQLKKLYEQIGNMLEEMQKNGKIPDTEKIPIGFSAKSGTKYKALLRKYQLSESIKNVEDHLANRKRLYRSVRLKLRKQISQEMHKEHIAIIAESRAQSARKLAPSGYEPQQVRDVEVTGLVQPAEEAIFQDGSAETVLSEDDDDDGVDEEVLEDQNIGSREEPECWIDLKQVVYLQIGGGQRDESWQPSAETLKARREFLTQWINKTDSVVPQSNLVCPRCQIDPTMGTAAKEKKYNLYRLNTHMRGATHTREAQFRRALKQDGKDNTSIIVCPVCKALVKGVRNFIKHLREFHEEVFWEDIDEEHVDGGEDVTDFEGFSDPRADEQDEEGDEEEREVMTDFEGVSSPLPAYIGKGKARAK